MLILIGKFKSQKNLDIHCEKSYFKEFAEKFPQMIEGSASIVTYEVDKENIIA